MDPHLRTAPEPLQWIVCAGGYRSGSTLQYKLIGGYLELTLQGQRMGYGSFHQVYQPHTGIGVVKSHALGGWDWYVMEGSAVAVSTERDQTAVEASMVRFFDINPAHTVRDTFVWRTDMLNRRLWDVVGTLQQPFEALTERPEACIREIVDHCGLEWDSESAKVAIQMAREQRNQREDVK